MKRLWLVGLGCVLWGMVSVPSPAVASCGDIIQPEPWFDYEQPFVATPITDCDNPFGVNYELPADVTITVGEQEVAAGGVVQLAASAEVIVDPANIPEPTDGGAFLQQAQLYRADGPDYRLVPIDVGLGVAPLPPGEYVLRIINIRIFGFFGPPPQDFEFPPDLVTTFPFTVEVVMDSEPDPESPMASSTASTTPPAATTTPATTTPATTTPATTTPASTTPVTVMPAGASSVLFLPGIQASRLYRDGLLWTEDQIWEPNSNGDVRQLAMTETGESVNEVYTRDVLDEIYGVRNIYQSLLDEMEALEENESIKEFRPFAYDWRHSVFDVVDMDIPYGNEGETERLLDTVVAMAEDSYTGQVTLIGHSNGGLVIKALLQEYGETELAGLIDSVVFVGTPQLGTPKAIGALLHGLDQQAGLGFIIDDETAREVMSNFPGAYTLLPSEQYFARTSEAVVTTDGSTLAAPVQAYGDIADREQLMAFLLDTKALRDEPRSMNEIAELNETMLRNATEEQRALDEWTASAEVDVFEIVGTGLPTIRGFEYREFGCNSNPFCITNSYLKPYPLFTSAGDETVIATSAAGYQGEKVSVNVDLRLESDDSFLADYKHLNMTESPVILNLLEEVVTYPERNEAIDIPPQFTEVSGVHWIISGHSPVDLQVETEVGTSGWADGQPLTAGPLSNQFTLGGSQFVVTSAAPTKISVEGTDAGEFTVMIDRLEGDKQEMVVVATGTSYEGYRGVMEFGGPDSVLVTRSEPEASTTIPQPEFSKAEVDDDRGNVTGTRVRPRPRVAGVATELPIKLQQLFMALKRLESLLGIIEQRYVR